MVHSFAARRLSMASAALACFLSASGVPAATVSFNRDVRPILSDNCFYCHGPDASHRQADLRLDIRDDAMAAGAIVPGKPAESTLVSRINSTESDELMPPPESHKKLDAKQKELLARWIEEGAEYQLHWAYEKPVKADAPAGVNGVDHLVRKRLAELGLKPSPEADRRTLIRRLSFDLLWPYRDWVIRSFNDNQPFDQFTIHQVAGDLVPDANQETRVGSGFNRLLLTTEEGGAQAKDYEARMLTDRVRAIGAAWLGQTTGCAQCHDHKFDPFKTRDFYALGAFFADIKEPIIGHPEDGMIVGTPEEKERLAELDAALAEAKKKFDAIVPQLDTAQQQWEADIVAYSVTLPELAADAKATDAEKNVAKQVAASLAKEPAKRDGNDKNRLRDYFRAKATKLFQAERDGPATAEKERKEFYDPLVKCLVSVHAETPRTVRILPRGNWMDETGEVVKPALPAYLPQPAIEGREPNRLDLAQWLVSRDNPLTARVVMNRLWRQFFGTGLSKVLDDLGAQGEPPANPELLDWLACEFMDSKWNMKHMVRTIVTSDAYKQTSVATPQLVAADPYNRELARQSTFRVDAECVRDAALSVSGLLVRTIGGPSVKPYQPDGYWENLNFPVRTYPNDTGEKQYRRGLYTWWQRSFLHPSMLAFDAPSREECCAERNRSNIPQQALVLLNDPSYVEAARSLAARILKECSDSPEERMAWAWRQVLQRLPRVEEMETVMPLVRTHIEHYKADPAAAESLLKTGLTAVPPDVDKSELAAWTHVARVLLNLHETITRP